MHRCGCGGGSSKSSNNQLYSPSASVAVFCAKCILTNWSLIIFSKQAPSSYNNTQQAVYFKIAINIATRVGIKVVAIVA